MNSIKIINFSLIYIFLQIMKRYIFQILLESRMIRKNSIFVIVHALELCYHALRPQMYRTTVNINEGTKAITS